MSPRSDAQGRIPDPEKCALPWRRVLRHHPGPRSHSHNLNTLFGYPEDIRKAIYTANAIESLNSVIRKAVKKRKLFPTDDSAMKVIYLAIR